MKTSTRLYDIIYSYYNKIYGDFRRDNRIVYFDNDFQFTHKLAMYDNEVKRTCRDTIFYGLDFLDNETRDKFEAEFISRFWTRSIKFQTSSQFNLRLVSFCRGILSIITDYYTNMDKLARMTEITTSHSNDESTSNSDKSSSSNSASTDETNSNSNQRSANADVSLPQDTASVDISSDNIDYADNISHTKLQNNSNSNQTSNVNSSGASQEINNATAKNDTTEETKKYDTNQLFLLQKYHDDLFNELDKSLFSQLK